ncbi:hypothetical protein M2651_05555 [Clostridium sp. SYSU_GA19001]|nr:hypothetical protein [Clostridium caldaquaticum]MCM8710490.1 hypothetical protein [Clostridium caldaquaticum]
MIKGIEYIIVNGQVIFQQNHIGKQDNNKILKNNVQAPKLKLTMEG